MKTKNTLLAVASAMLLLLNPSMLSAQWSAVRFDHYNTFYNVSAPTSNTVFVTGTDPVNSEYFILRTNDGGIIWDSIPVNTATDIFQLAELFFLDVNTGFVGGLKNSNQVLLKTTDNGFSWTDITPNPFSTAYIISVYFIDAQNGLATDGTTLYKTFNGGAAWTPVVCSFNLRDLFFSDMNNGFVCGDNGGTAVVMQTSDGGQNWNTLLSDSDPNLFVSSFAKLHVVNSNVSFTAMEYTNKLYRTTDGGNSWQTIVVDSINLIRDFDFASADIGHVLGDIGWGLEYRIMYTVDGAQNCTTEYTTGWNFYGGGVALNAFTFVDHTGYTTGSSGLVKKYFPSTTGISEEEFNATASVYPNPASTTLTVMLQDDRKITVTNLLGDIIMQQISPYGKNTVDLDVSSLSPGIYFVKAGNEVRKFIKE
jgi:photosystem II stability/assembly factor-like uncharacterized protein